MGNRSARRFRQQKRQKAARRGATAKTKEPSGAVEGQVGDHFEALCISVTQNGAVDPRSFVGHALQTAKVLSAGSRATVPSIIFGSKCGAYCWEGTSAFCKACPFVPGGCSANSEPRFLNLRPSTPCPPRGGHSPRFMHNRTGTGNSREHQRWDQQLR